MTNQEITPEYVKELLHGEWNSENAPLIAAAPHIAKAYLKLKEEIEALTLTAWQSNQVAIKENARLLLIANKQRTALRGIINACYWHVEDKIDTSDVLKNIIDIALQALDATHAEPVIATSLPEEENRLLRKTLDLYRNGLISALTKPLEDM